MSWTTKITKIEPNRIAVRGEPIDALMGHAGFAEVVYLLLKGERPSAAHARLVEAILVSSVDHGVTPPSAVAARTVASCGAPLSSAVAAGVLAISRHHGGAVEGCMEALSAAAAAAARDGVAATAKRVVDEARAAGTRLPGFGHRLHDDDPRATRLLALAKEEKAAGAYVEMAGALRDALEAAGGKRLPLNVDGAIAALLLEMGFPPTLGNAFFIIARVPGLVAHAREEASTQRPMRTIVPADAVYEGP